MSEAGEETAILDRIGQELPIEVRAAYYRELNYCRSLPENDELLRVLRAMQFLTLLMQQTPERVVAEREKLERLFSDAMKKLSDALESSGKYQRGLEERLSALPAEVAEGLRPEQIARSINENLRQQFAGSTLPQTAQAMTAIAAQLREAVGDFGKTAAWLNHSHRGAAEDARRAIAELERTVSQASETARCRAVELSAVFRREFRWSLYALSSFALVLGLGLGMLYQQWIDSPPERPAQSRAAVERPPAKVKSKAAH